MKGLEPCRLQGSIVPNPKRLRRLPLRILVGLLVAVWMLAPAGSSLGFAGQSPRDLSIAVDPDLGRLDILYRGRRLLVYAFASNQFKPYVKELYTLAGDNLLLDAPADHLHHHALMYAIRVNGVNFWEEAQAPGHQVSVQAPQQSVGISARGLPQAAFVHQLHWVAHTNAGLPDTTAAALLVEQRAIIVSVDEKKGEVALQWQSDFEVGPAASAVKLDGADYHGLGVRFPRSWDRVATHLNSENLPYPTRGKRDVLEARWSAVAKRWDGHEATLAVFAGPRPMRGTTKFFSMLEPFTYLSTTQGLDTAPLEYRRGDKFSLNYVVLVYPATKTREFLQERYQVWVK